ncbi:MAG: ABC transporter substrate-binding protein [Pseudomonadota bacterium]
MKSVFQLSLVMALHVSAATSGAQVLVDDAGRDVEVPQPLTRVVGTHDVVIGLPLFELGLTPVGVWMRKDPSSGEDIIMGLEQLFNTTASEAGITNIGGYDGTDLEVIKQLNPELIVVTESSEEQIDVLETVAPVFVQRTYSGDVFGLSAVKVMAQRFGLQTRFDELQRVYRERVDAIKAQLPFDPAEKTLSVIFIWDQLHVANGLSGMMQALGDLGFKTPEWVISHGEQGFMAPLSSEEIGLIQEDFVIFGNGYGQGDTSEEAAREKLDKIAPGWDRFIKPELGIAFFNAELTITPTFASAHAALDAIEAHFITTR